MSLKRRPSRRSVIVSLMAMLVGISLAMNPLCRQANAQDTPLLGRAKSDHQAPEVHAKLWPESKSPIGLDARIEERIDGLLQRMTVEEKVGQVVQPEWKSISPAEVAQYHIGSIENGGGAVPGGNKHSSRICFAASAKSLLPRCALPAWTGRSRRRLRWHATIAGAAHMKAIRRIQRSWPNMPPPW